MSLPVEDGRFMETWIGSDAAGSGSPSGNFKYTIL